MTKFRETKSVRITARLVFEVHPFIRAEFDSQAKDKGISRTELFYQVWNSYKEKKEQEK